MLLPDSQIKDLLLQSGQVSQEEIVNLQQFAINARVPLQEAAIEKDTISDQNLGILIANFLKYPFIFLSNVTIPENVFRIVPERLARKYKIVSFAKDAEVIKLAMADPKNSEILQMISKKTGLKVTPYFATERDIENALQAYTKDLQQIFDELLQGEIGINVATDDAPIAKI